jgi:hypothetical protein
MQSNTLLDLSRRDYTQGCEGSFEN